MKLKKTYILTLLFLFITPYLYTQEVEPLELRLWGTYPKGLNTNLSSQLIDNLEFKQCQNVYIDKDLGVVCREGNKQVNSTFLSSAPVKFSYNYSKVNGIKYYIVISSNVLAYSQNAVTFTTLLSTIPVNSKIWAVTYNDDCYIGLNNGDRWRFDGTSLYTSTIIPQCKYATVFYDKLVCVNINETNGGSKLTYSKIGDFNAFGTLDWIYLQKDDGDEIRGIKVYRNGIYVFKTYSIIVMKGLENDVYSDDGYENTVTGIGCLYNETISEKDGYLLFISKRGLERFDGVSVNIDPLSDRIEPDIMNLTQMDELNLTWTETTGQDFNGGSYIYNVSTSAVDGSVSFTGNSIMHKFGDASSGENNPSLVLDSNGNPHVSYRNNDNSNLYYSSYTIGIGWSTNVVVGTGGIGYYSSIALDSNGIPYIAYYSTAQQVVNVSSYTGGNTWYTTVVDTKPGGDLGEFCTIKIDSKNIPHVLYCDSDTGLKISSYTGTGNTHWSTATITGTKSRGSLVIDNNNIAHVLYVAVVGNNNYIKYSSWTVQGIISTVTFSAIGSVVYQQPPFTIGKDNVKHFTYINIGSLALISSSYTGNSTILSTITVFNDGVNTIFPPITTNNLNQPVIVYGLGGTTAYLGTYTTGWMINKITVGNTVGTIYEIKLDIDNTPFFVYNVGSTIYLYSLFGEYVSKKFNATTGEYNWRGWDISTITENKPANTTIKYYTKTATSEGGLATVTPQSILTGEGSKSNAGSWIQYIARFTNITSTTDLRMDSFAINYTIDYQNKPLLGFTFDRRYFLAGGIYPAIDNNTLYVLDRNNNWSKFTNMNISSMIEFKNDFYWGTSEYTGKINRFSSDYSDDNGTHITPLINTKDFNLGGVNKDFYFGELWAVADPSVVHSTMTVGYEINKSTNMSTYSEIDLTANTNNIYTPITTQINRDETHIKYLSIKIFDFDTLTDVFLKYGVHGE